MMEMHEIIKLAHQGDESAQRTLYNMYRRRLLVICHRVTGNYNEAEELTHDAFLLAFSHLHTLKDSHKFGQWISSIAYNLALRQKKQRSQQTIVPLSFINEDNLIPDDIEDFANVPQWEELMVAVNKLPKGYRNVFKMAVIQEMSHKEIAEILHIAEHSSSSQLARAKKMLRKILLQMGIFTILLMSIIFSIYYVSKESNKELLIAKKDDKQDTSIFSNNSEESCKKDDVIKSSYIHTINNISIADSSFTSIISKQKESVLNDTANKSQEIIEKDKEQSSKKSINLKLQLNNLRETQFGWSLALAYIGDVTRNYNTINPISFMVNMPNIDTESPTGNKPNEFMEITKWIDMVEYLNWADIPKEKRSALIKIANANIQLGEQTINRKSYHDYPVSLEMTLQRKINERWSIESGISYTLLSSKFTTGVPQAGIIEEQKIHYIGIPVKGLFTLWNSDKFCLYSSAGVSVEIPIKSGTTVDYVLNGTSIYNTCKELNVPLQWTVNLGLGIQYNITPNIGVYAEPNLRYYIPDNSSIETYRTEHPFTITMPIGLRLKW